MANRLFDLLGRERGKGHRQVGIARNIPPFSAFWLRYCVVERGGTLFNDNFEIDAPIHDTARDRIRTITGSGDTDAALTLPPGE